MGGVADRLSDVQPQGLRVEDGEGEVTFLGFFESAKAAEEHALPPFEQMVVSNLGAPTP